MKHNLLKRDKLDCKCYKLPRPTVEPAGLGADMCEKLGVLLLT